MLAKLLRVRLVMACAAVIVCVFLSVPAYSQVDTGSVRGVVKDPAGAVIPGAKVTLTSEDTGLAVETVTSRDGNYSFSPVKVGTYTLEVEFKNHQNFANSFASLDFTDKANCWISDSSLRREVIWGQLARPLHR